MFSREILLPTKRKQNLLKSGSPTKVSLFQEGKSKNLIMSFCEYKDHHTKIEVVMGVEDAEKLLAILNEFYVHIGKDLEKIKKYDVGYHQEISNYRNGIERAIFYGKLSFSLEVYTDKDDFYWMRFTPVKLAEFIALIRGGVNNSSLRP